MQLSVLTGDEANERAILSGHARAYDPIRRLSARSPKLATTRGKTKILVVEDTASWRSILVSILRSRPDLEIACEISDGITAVKQASELQPELILLDIGIPELNGLEAAKIIRTLSPQSKIVFVTQDRKLATGGDEQPLRAFPSYEQLAKFMTTEVPDTEAYFGNFREAVLAVRTDWRLEVSRLDSDSLKKLQVCKFALAR